MQTEEFRARREHVLEAIHPGALVLFSAPVAMRNNDVEHEYRQDSDFFYLSGLDQPESVLVLSSVREPHYTLFVRPRDPEREVWDGPRPGVEGASSEYGADAAHPREELDAKLPELLKDVPRLFYALGRVPQRDAQVLGAIAALRRRTREALTWPTEIHEPEGVLHELRLRKRPKELELMRRAVAITADAHLDVMRSARPGMHEYELEAQPGACSVKLGRSGPRIRRSWARGRTPRCCTTSRPIARSRTAI
jgi:Xaa-Pro aminopeptidase